MWRQQMALYDKMLSARWRRCTGSICISLLPECMLGKGIMCNGQLRSGARRQGITRRKGDDVGKAVEAPTVRKRSSAGDDPVSYSSLFHLVSYQTGRPFHVASVIKPSGRTVCLWSGEFVSPCQWWRKRWGEMVEKRSRPRGHDNDCALIRECLNQRKIEDVTFSEATCGSCSRTRRFH
jgi:hypothetical protein